MDTVENLSGAPLEHQPQQEADARARQQRRQKFLGSDLGNAD